MQATRDAGVKSIATLVWGTTWKKLSGGLLDVADRWAAIEA